MSITAETICNNALLSLGQETIASLDDAHDPQAVGLSRIFAARFLALQQEHDWYFNRRRADLEAADVEKQPEWRYAYVLPADYLANLRVIDACGQVWPYRREGDVIYCNTHQAKALYTGRVEPADVGTVPGWFADLLAMDLAKLLAPKFVGKDQYITLRADRNLREAWQDALAGNGRQAYAESAGREADGNTDVYEGFRNSGL